MWQLRQSLGESWKNGISLTRQAIILNKEEKGTLTEVFMSSLLLECLLKSAFTLADFNMDDVCPRRRKEGKEGCSQCQSAALMTGSAGATVPGNPGQGVSMDSCLKGVSGPQL